MSDGSVSGVNWMRRRKTEHARERDRERRLADARAVLEQNVTACINRHQDLLDDHSADKRAV